SVRTAEGWCSNAGKDSEKNNYTTANFTARSPAEICRRSFALLKVQDLVCVCQPRLLLRIPGESKLRFCRAEAENPLIRPRKGGLLRLGTHGTWASYPL